MALEPNDIRDFLEDEVTFPSDTDTILTEIGNIEIAAPDAEESETVATLLADIEAEGYESADELTQILHSMLPDEYVGRKYYDDRSDEPDEQRVKEDKEDQSF